MKKSRLVVAGAVSTLVLGSLSTVATAQPVAPSAPEPPASSQLQHHTPPVSAAVTAAARTWPAKSARYRAALGTQRVVPHLAPRLNRLAGVPGAAAVNPAEVSVNPAGRVEVTVTGPGALAAAKVTGARVLATFGNTASVTLLPDKLRSLAGQPGVSRVEPANQATPQSTSEGVSVSGANRWTDQGNVGNQGAGMDIGVVDAGFGSLQAEIGNGNLGPAGTVVYGADQNHCNDQNGTAHGTAVAEIVHQMAPKAILHLYCVQDSVGFAQSANQIVTAGVKVVNSSLAFLTEPRGVASRGDGYGAPGSSELAVKTAREAGVLWVQASGNSAADHWPGTLADTNKDGLVDLKNANEEVDQVALAPGTAGQIVLNWDQWPTSSTPVTLAVAEYDSQNRPVGDVHFIDHVPGQDPVLTANITNTGADLHLYSIAIVDASAPTLHYDLTYGGDVYPSTFSGDEPARAASGSVLQPANSPWALAVGAADWQTGTVEAFSSRGPSIDGRVKPDLIGYDGVSTNIAEVRSPSGGSGYFYGTSAAAPHVAGAAALVLAANPGMDAADIQAFLERRASRNTSPATNALGHGLINLGDPSGVQGVPGSRYVPFATPNRIVDTRSGLGVRAGVLIGGTALPVTVATTGTNAVPADATSVVISLSGTAAQGSTYLSVYSAAFGGNSTLNLNSRDANATVTAVVKLNSKHGFLLRNQAAKTHALISLLGYFAAPAATGGLGYVALPSARLLDTRTGVGAPKAKLTPNQSVPVDATTGGVPADATAAVVNMTALNQTAGGYLTAYPTASPAIASVDYHQFSRSNLVLVPLVAGRFVVQNRAATTDAMIDIVGYFSLTATARFVALPSPARIADSRTGNGGHYGTMTANSTFTVDAGGLNGVPYDVSGLWVGLTAIAAGNGYVSIYPAGTAAPHASNMDFTNGRVVPNAAIATLSPRTATAPPRFTTVNRFGSSNILEDAYGYFVSPGPN